MNISEARDFVASHVKAVSFYQIDYSDLENLVNSYFDLDGDYDFVQTKECRNDSTHTFNVKRSDAAVHPLEDEWYYSYGATYTALGHLCADGIIPEGTYLVDVCW
jgi:hypothetical protein